MAEEAVDVLIATSADWRQRLQHITETMRRMSRHTDPQEMVREYTQRMQGFVHFDRMLSLTRRGETDDHFLVARDTFRKDQPNPWEDREKLPRLTGGLLGQLLRDNQPRIINDLAVDPADPAFEFLDGFNSLAAIPLFEGGEALNLVVFLMRRPDAFDPVNLPQMVWTTGLFGRATHNLVISSQLQKANASLDREMKTIADIQRSLLPQELPQIPTLDFAVYYQPATQAGGDYYDFFPLPENRWGILIADVAGHGSPAAVLMAITHALAHTIALPGPQSAANPAVMLRYLNHHLAEKYTANTARFVTAFFAVYDPATRRLAYSSAGHPPPRVKQCNGQLLGLDDAVGLPLGIDPDAVYTTAAHTLKPGDQVVLYTDGISEARDKQGNLFGITRLDQALEQCRADAAALIETLLAAVDQFAAGRVADDDRALLIAKVTS